MILKIMYYSLFVLMICKNIVWVDFVTECENLYTWECQVTWLLQYMIRII